MGEYISREYLLAEYDRQHQGPPGGARRIIAEAPAADVAERPRWVPVAERLPSPGIEVLVFTRDGGIWVDKFFGVLFGLPTFAKKGAKRVTHWMPLPPAPKEATP